MPGAISIQDASIKLEVFLLGDQKAAFLPVTAGGRYSMTKDEIRKVEALAKSNKGYRAIARELGLSANTVKSYLVRHKEGSLDFCLYCGKKFIVPTGKRIKRFCSKECRCKYWNRRVKKASDYQKQFVCEECGETFFAYRRLKRKFCCLDCYRNNVQKKWRNSHEE